MNNLHDHGGGGGGHGDMEEMDCPMLMSFHAGHCESILWKAWTARTELQFILSAIGIFIVGFLYEGLKYLRDRYYQQISKRNTTQLLNHQNIMISNNGTCCSSNNTNVLLQHKTLYEKMFNKPHLIQTLMHFVQIVLSYLLMLIVMTYNYWLFAAVVLGASVGYFCFGWIRQQASDSSEHCH